MGIEVFLLGSPLVDFSIVSDVKLVTSHDDLEWKERPRSLEQVFLSSSFCFFFFLQTLSFCDSMPQ